MEVVMAMNQKRLEKIVELHFKNKVSQTEIAELLGISQTTVSRSIKKAEERGLIQAYLNDVYTDEVTKKRQLICEKYGLKAVLILLHADIYSSEGMPFLTRLGELGAKYVEKILKDFIRIAVAHGRTLFFLIKALQERRMNCEITPLTLMRGIDLEEGKIPAAINAIFLAGKFWRDYNWDEQLPVFRADINNKSITEIVGSMSEEPYVKESLERIRNCDLLLTSVGPLYKESTIVRGAEKMGISFAELAKAGIVGTICHTPVDINGKPSKFTELNKLPISVPLSDIRKLSLDEKRDVILVSGGIEKREIIKTALMGNYCNVLVTDAPVADFLLRES